MRFMNIMMAVVSIGLTTTACNTKSSDGLAGSGTQLPAGSTTKTPSSSNASAQQTPAGSTTQQEVIPITTTGQQTPTTAATTTTDTPIPAKYANYQDPSQLALTDPTNIKLYNYLSEGIVSVNGHPLKVGLIPPGKTWTMTKFYSDIDQNTGEYILNVVTESGLKGEGRFDPTAVDDAAWRASVTLVNNQVVVQQNAGGGGGGGDTGTTGSSDARSLQNFR